MFAAKQNSYSISKSLSGKCIKTASVGLTHPMVMQHGAWWPGGSACTIINALCDLSLNRIAFYIRRQQLSCNSQFEQTEQT